MITWANGVALGPYMLISPIGAGGMGEVWKARDTRLNRVVAVKRMAVPHSERFQQEAHAIAALNHPHICTLHDVGPDYLVMEYIEGRPLRGPLPQEKAVELAIQIASALEAAHRRGIIHRDLKPANLMVTESGAVKLLDFGLAKFSTGSDLDVTRTMEGMVLGTAAYMAPEQAEGKPLDERSDVFSFGAVLYEMISGTRAFGGSSPSQVLYAVVHEDPRPLEAPAELARIVTRCLRKAPTERFQNMTEVRTSLERVYAKPVDHQPSIAVLPFANLSADKEQEYFSDGLAEEIINALAHVPGLKVIARTSAFAFKGKQEDIRRIAEALGVATVLEGSVRRAGSRIRVTAQLITAADGSHLWSERFDREMSDVFALQDEIAEAIASALKIKLAAGTKTLQRYTPNLGAYEAYLKGLYYQQKFSREMLTRARECYEQAIALDPQFALPLAGLSFYFISRATQGTMPAREAMPLARQAAQRGLEIDPSLSDSHALLGIVAAAYDYDWKESERQFALSMASDPVSANARASYGFFYLLPMGRPLEGADEIRLALKEDPLHVGIRFYLAQTLVAAGRHDEALKEAREILEMDERFVLAYAAVSICYQARGMLAEALVSAEKFFTQAPWFHGAAGMFAALLKLTGNATRSAEVLQTLGSGDAYGAPIGLALFYFTCGDIERGADWVEKAIEQRIPQTPIMLATGRNTGWRAVLRSSARWPRLSALMNLPETAWPLQS